MKHLTLTLFAMLIGLAGCGTGPNIFTVFEKQYWRIDTQGEDGKWETNWHSWFENEKDCLRIIEDNQRFRQRRM